MERFFISCVCEIPLLGSERRWHQLQPFFRAGITPRNFLGVTTCVNSTYDYIVGEVQIVFFPTNTVSLFDSVFVPVGVVEIFTLTFAGPLVRQGFITFLLHVLLISFAVVATTACINVGCGGSSKTPWFSVHLLGAAVTAALHHSPRMLRGILFEIIIPPYVGLYTPRR